MAAMKTHLLAVLFLSSLGCRAHSSANVTAPALTEVRVDPSREGAVATAHFDIRWDAGAATEAEIRAVQERAEGAWQRYTQLLGPTRMPIFRVVIHLVGDGKPGDFPTVVPETGEVQLMRFPGHGGGYEASIAHELVHAMRRARWLEEKHQTAPALFLEEGYAELLATEAGYPSTGFPTYGFPLAVVAGSWLTPGQDLPVSELIRKHRQLNFRCMAQAYGERLSFVFYMRERLGFEGVTRLAYADAPLTVPMIEAAMGSPLDSLGAQWRTWAVSKSKTVPNAAELQRQYRHDTAIQYFPVCGEGVSQ
jgi:hypothetical protein